MRPTFEKTVDILIKAYLNDTLEPGNYCACAVGNLIADAVGAKIVEGKNHSCSKYKWIHHEYTGSEWYVSKTSSDARRLIKSTGYTFEEIWEIEKAFEKERRCSDVTDTDQLMFRGLMAVVDVLAEIHGIDLKQREEAKLLFQKV